MLIHFNIEYITRAEQSLTLLLNFTDENGIDQTQYRPMSVDDVNQWKLALDLNVPLNTLRYKYAISEDCLTSECEYGDYRRLDHLALNPTDTLFVHDAWRVRNGESPFTTSAFTQCFFKRTVDALLPSSSNFNLILGLHCPKVGSKQHIAIVGNQNRLGNWDVNLKVRLDDAAFPYWMLNLAADDISFPLEYKYLLVDTASDSVLSWSVGENFKLDGVEKSAQSLINDGNVQFSTASWKAAGVAIPVFSLRSESGFGVGEFTDLTMMVDWAKATGQKMIQILPINDTTLTHTNGDSYPYNAVSVYALHPIYIHLDSLGVPKDKQFLKSFEKAKQTFNTMKTLDYKGVMEWKWRYFKAIYQQESSKTFQTKKYLDFFENNKEWLVPYAAFSYLRDLNATPYFGTWKDFSVYNYSEVQELVSPEKSHYHDVAIYYFLQFHLHTQLSEVRSYALSQGVALKGDIPIGISPSSVDAWVHPELFNATVQAGAPPDDFSVTGQNWGFPTYNWELMEKDGYEWWRKRFQKLSDYFDAYRIDHILGFFRIWEIPSTDVWGLKGSFNPALPYSIQELEEKGIQWDEKRFLQPFLTKSIIKAIAGKNSTKVLAEFVCADKNGNCWFKPEYDTQRKVKKYFDDLGRTLNAQEKDLRDALFTMLSEVLFMRDLRQTDKVNPRISMPNSFTFLHLSPQTQEALKELYYDYFYHRHSAFWKEQAMKKLPALISATDMLVCGEDLGMIPETVPEVMEDLEVLSLEIQRMPKQMNVAFGNPADAPYLSVCTSSTHDMNPIRAWWTEDKHITQQYYNQMLAMEGDAPLECSAAIARKIIEQHLQSEAMWIILPWQDWMAMDENLRHPNPHDERINVPSNPSNYWCYRMHISLEQLLGAKDFNLQIKTMIQDSNRR